MTTNLKKRIAAKLTEIQFDYPKGCSASERKKMTLKWSEERAAELFTSWKKAHPKIIVEDDETKGWELFIAAPFGAVKFFPLQKVEEA